MSEYIAPAPERHLAQMLVATTIVAVLPLASSLALRASGVISSGWLSVAFAIALSLGASAAGSAYWRKHGAGEVLFSELLLWGWIRRWRQERELANATRLLQLATPDQEEALTVERREHLLRQLAGALEDQDLYLNGHSRRVARHAMMIARGMGLPSEEVARIRAAAAVHDVGKLLTPKAILNKPGRLTDAEFEVIKRHPVDGAEMVDALSDPALTRIVRHHHERLDGAGYPDRLRGEEIPLGARIIAVADTFDAITSARPYRAAAPHQKAIDILRKEAGTQLDPEAVRSFLAYYSGSRPTVVWALVTSSVRRVVAWLSGDPAAAATLSAGKVAAATVATAAVGVAAGATPVPRVHPVRPAPVTSIQHVAAPVHTLPGRARLHAAVPVSTLTSSPRAAAHSRRARAATGHAAASHRHHPAHAASSHGRGDSSSAAGKPASRASTSPGTPSTNSHPSNAASTPGTAPSSSSHAVSNSSAGGASSRPTSTNPAGHVNHASSTGNAARNGQPPHPATPSHPMTPSHPATPAQPASLSHPDPPSGNGQVAATTPALSHTSAAPPSATPPSAGAPSVGAGQASGNATASGNAGGNPGAAPASSGGPGSGSGAGNDSNGNGQGSG